MSPARAAAWKALKRLLAASGPLDDSLAGFPELDGLSERDRGLAHELVTGTVKRRLSLDAVLAGFVSAPLERTAADVLECLRLATYQLVFLDRVPAYAAVDDAVAMVRVRGKRTQGFVNAVLRKVAAEGRAKYAGLAAGETARAWEVRYSCPGWIVKLARRELGDEAAAGLLAAAEPPERCLRVNSLRANMAEAEDALRAAGFAVKGVPGLPDALLYSGPPLERSAPFRKGLVTAQSRGSQMAGITALGGAAPRDLLDLCAAPGTKTTQLAALAPRARLVAIDADAGRIEIMRRNLLRLGAGDVEICEADVAELPESHDAAYDAVLLDAPCSGLGTLGSRADLRWRRRAGDVSRLAQLQRALLVHAARCVRPGGTLTYAVCTWPRAETLDVVRPLLESGGWEADDLGAVWPGMSHPESGGYLLALPPEHGSTAFFVARLRRQASPGSGPGSAAG